MNASDFSLMIFAAGFGTRMAELTNDMPKPMLPLSGRPMVDYAVDLARDAGIQNIAANTHYLSGKIEPHLARLGVSVCREEPEILDTGGGLRAASQKLVSPTFTLNPDAAWLGANPLTELSNAWRDHMQALLLLVPSGRAKGRKENGDFSIGNGRLKRGGPLIYTGAQIIRTEGLARISLKAFSLNVYWDALEKDGALYGAIYSGHWCDIGTPEGLTLAEQMLDSHRV
ncbi:MAG: nucleotidyltransferase family protein [Boseongicola sp.]